VITGRTVVHEFACRLVSHVSEVKIAKAFAMSIDSPEPTLNEPTERPSRNPIERVIVWGGIGLLLVVVGIEARAQRGYAMSLDAVQAAFADNEEVQIELADARKLMTLSPAEVKDANSTGIMDYYRFSWFSLFKSGEYEITLKVSNDNSEVISFATSAAPDLALAMTAPALSESSMSEFEDYSGGGEFPGGGNSFGGGRFQPPPNPLVTHLDSDGDNELSAEEIEGSPAVLLALDANGDGELTREEFDPEGFSRRSGGETGSFGSGGVGGNEPNSGRPRRPEIEE
jgi:hypothetical protein